MVRASDPPIPQPPWRGLPVFPLLAVSAHAALKLPRLGFEIVTGRASDGTYTSASRSQACGSRNHSAQRLFVNFGSGGRSQKGQDGGQ